MIENYRTSPSTKSRKRRRPSHPPSPARVLVLVVFISTCCITLAEGSQRHAGGYRSSRGSWDEDSSGLIFLSESEGEERILSALAGATESSDGTSNDDEETNDNYEQESHYTATGTEMESSSDGSLRIHVGNRNRNPSERQRERTDPAQ